MSNPPVPRPWRRSVRTRGANCSPPYDIRGASAIPAVGDHQVLGPRAGGRPRFAVALKYMASAAFIGRIVIEVAQ